jgi:PAS domain S-box-containing protein
MSERAAGDSSELTFLRNRVAEFEAKTAGLHREMEHLLNTSQRLTKSGGWQWDVAQETMTWTEETYRIHDIDPREVIQGSPEHIALSQACYAPEDQPKIINAFQRCVELGEAYDLEFSFTTRKGRKLWIRTTAEAVWEDGRVARVRGNIQDITDRKLTEQHLKIYQNIISSAPDGIAFVDAQYRYVIVNDTYERFSGVSRDKFIGLTVAEYLGEEVFEKFVKPRLDTCLRGETVSFQEWFDYPTLGRRFIEVTYSPYRNLLNQVAGVVANTRDITNRKRTADLLAARLRLSEAAVSLGLNDVLTMALDEAEALTDSRIGFFHFFDEDQKTITLQAWSTATSGTFCQAEGFGLHYNLESAGVWADCIRQRRAIVHNDYAGLSHRRGMPDGHAPVVRELVVPVFRNERIVAIFAVGNKTSEYTDKDTELVSNLGDLVWDIVLRKRAEESLKESEERFRTLASLAPVGIYLTSPEGLCQYANRCWCEMAGLTQAEALGTGWIFGLHPDDRDMVYGNWQQMVESASHWGLEYRFRTPGGKTTWVYGLAAPQRDGTGKIIRYVFVTTDITEKKRDEEAIKNSLAEKEVLLREVHHRVKNNMAAIIGLFNLQRQAMDNPQAQTIMAELSSRVKAMSLVHEKLYRSESLARIDFQDYLQSLISHLRTSFGSPSIRCEIKAFGVEMPLDLAVPCGMIINELVSNALKYAFPQERSKTLKKDEVILVAMTRDNDIVSLSVADNGVGLPQGFDLNTVKSLGLVLVRMLGQHQLGGSYEVDQTDGTRFHLTFSMRSGRKGHE